MPRRLDAVPGHAVAPLRSVALLPGGAVVARSLCAVPGHLIAPQPFVAAATSRSRCRGASSRRCPRSCRCSFRLCRGRYFQVALSCVSVAHRSQVISALLSSGCRRHQASSWRSVSPRSSRCPLFRPGGPVRSLSRAPASSIPPPGLKLSFFGVR